MTSMLQHDPAWDHEENIRKIHEILDIVLDTNSLDVRSMDKTGALPTVGFRFSGLCGKVVVELYPDGWHGGMNYREFTFNTDEEISQRAIDEMGRECKAALEGKAAIEYAQYRISKLEQEIRERQQEMEQLHTYIEESRAGSEADSSQDTDMPELEIEEEDD